MNLALEAKARSTCPRLQVGAVLVNAKHHIISTGYNGSQPGEPHCTDVGCAIHGGGCTRTVHAERNAINRTKRKDRAGSTLYVTTSPCPSCGHFICHRGITEVVYLDEYRLWSQRDIDKYHYHGIIVRKLNA